jgi:hypothetical protein
MNGICAHCDREVDSSYLVLYESKFRSFYACDSCVDWFVTMDETYHSDWKKNEKAT